MRLGLCALGIAAATALPWLAGCDEFQIVPSCSDGFTNGDETDVDCGGGTCDKCAMGKACKQTKDCVSGGECSEGFCAPPPVGVWEKASDMMPAPTARQVAAMVYDGSAIVLFGGADALKQALNDTWRWDGDKWSAMTPPATPPGRYGANLVYDAGASRAVLFGGFNPTVPGFFLNDTWAWNGGAWIALSSMASPDARWLAMAAYDTQKRETILLSGAGAKGRLEDIWRLSGQQWTQMNVAIPPPRWAGSMAYDEDAKQSVLFGGTSAQSSPELDDTWTLNEGRWDSVEPAQRPTGRAGAAMAYDAASKRVILFGGASNNASLGDTWEWDGKTWRSVTIPMLAPPARFFAAMAYDPGRRRVVLFGGNPNASSLLGDTWEYHRIGNPCRSGKDCETRYCVDGLCCESQSCDTGQVCNLPTSPGRCASPGVSCPDAGSDAGSDAASDAGSCGQ